MSRRLAGKVCIITGTGGSIGRAAALAFAGEGALVVGCDLNVDAAEATVTTARAAGGTMVSLQPCQLSKPADCQALVDLAVRSFGRNGPPFLSSFLPHRSEPVILSEVRGTHGKAQCCSAESAVWRAPRRSANLQGR